MGPDSLSFSICLKWAFHHEPISYLRKKDHEYIEIVKPKFSTVLRLIDDKRVLKKGEGLVCSDVDFSTAMSMIKVLLIHAVRVFQSLPRKASKPVHKGRQQMAAAAREKFLAELPDSFDRPAYLAVAASLGIPVKTAERYLTESVKSGQLSHPAHDLYTKVAL